MMKMEIGRPATERVVAGFLQLMGGLIHAPTRGATKITGTEDLTFDPFNPRTRAGCDTFCSVHSQPF